MQPATSPQNKTRASERGGVLGQAGVVDVAALSYAARRHTIRIPLPALVQNATTAHVLGAAGLTGTIVGAFLTYRTNPAVSGGTATYQLAVRNAAGTQTLYSASANLLTLTAARANAVTLSSTPDVAADTTLELQLVVSNNAPTQGVDGFLTLVFDPTEPTVTAQ
jgi:hypothetical protein